MEWKGWRGFDEGIVERILLPIENIEAIKKYILGRTINFGEIAGKHSEVYNSLDENDITIIEDISEIEDFLRHNPSQHDCNHSFLNTFYCMALDGCFEDITEEEAHNFAKLW